MSTGVTESGSTRISPSTPLKRKLNDTSEENRVVASAPGEHGDIVAAHYNNLEDKGREERKNSPIFYMRNFNNFIKSMLINEYLNLVTQNRRVGDTLKVLDLCCGKGGDLLKWKKGGISHLICSDIASVSVEQCEARYKDMGKRGSHFDKTSLFTAEFITADCTKVRLREKYQDASLRLDLVSCQFAFHYSFESLAQAECMLKNAAESIRPGGFFIGSIPDANEIISRCQKNDGKTFGNDIFQVTLEFDPEQVGYPLFGAKYCFHLEGVVDCPEFLVHFPTFVKLAKEFGLDLVYKERFEDYFKKVQNNEKNLISKMKCFETYPPLAGVPLISTRCDGYEHAQKYLNSQDIGNNKLGTMSKSEWEAATIYMVFAFQKGNTMWDAEGKPVYSSYKSK